MSRPVVSLLLLLLTLPAARIEGREPPTWAVELLRTREVPVESPALLEWLRGRLPNADFRERVEAAVRLLGSDEFRTREAATRTLVELGPAVLPRLEGLFDDPDPEVAMRARLASRRLRTGRGDPFGEPVVIAALTVLRDRPVPETVDVLLEVVPQMPSGAVRELAAEAVWRSTVPEHHDALLTRLNRKGGPESIVLVAYEATLAAEASPARIEPYLNSDDEAVRLAAARALLDRRPAAARAALVELLDAKSTEVRRHVTGLLAIVLGDDPPPDSEDAHGWQAYFARTDRAGMTPRLGPRRWFVSPHETIFAEYFDGDATIKVGGGFRGLRLQSKAAVVCRVGDGVLRIPEASGESDSRMALDLKRMFPDAEPSRLRIVVELSSDGRNPVGWHPGVSIGKVKFLFHPGYSTGAFRAEDVDSHDYLLGNQSMGFTPRTNAFHRMTIQFERRDGKDRVAIDVQDVDLPENHFRTTLFGVKSKKFGPLHRVALERSGRDGGDAQFRSFLVQVPRTK